MKISQFIKEKKLGLSFLLIFFILLIISLVIRNFFLKTYPISIFFVILIFIFSQYFDFEYRLLIGFALFLLIICVFLLIFKLDTLAEYFANCVYGFLVIGIVGYFFDNLREKLKSKGTIKIYKKVFLSILVIFLLSSTFIFVRDFRRNTDYTVVIKENFTVVIKENFIKFVTSAKDKYIKTFKKDIYYSGMDAAEVDGKKISRDIIINIDNPKADSIISKTIDLSGWAIETNSIYNTGIDRIEFFLDGKPGEGKYLGKFTQNYSAELETKKFIKNLYFHLYDRMPTSQELNFWAINLEYGIMSYKEVANNITNKYDFMGRNLSNKNFLARLFAGLFRRTLDGTWIDRLENDLSREDVLYTFINSIEFNKLSENYYKNITLKNYNLDIIRKDIGEKYGEQFCLSGFSFEFDSTAFPNGEHTLYIYAHSPVFGWDYQTVNLIIDNH